MFNHPHPFRARLEAALENAYAHFRADYPAWQDTLWDRHFLKAHLLPELQQGLEHGQVLSAPRIARLWAEHLGLSPELQRRWRRELELMAANFLCHLEHARPPLPRSPVSV
ncbi:MAG: hypothetical protein C4333_10950 [Meiothermus sp.]